ncbi:Aldo/keto reductase [Sistotremastrum suecicum HHB10207 ss-3]|uniref:Aldo/keto reductase n=1 Tax=Sistotremastrum suecicum HHB10207 ss-3 TaxID=1314776 RepID=A0A166CYV1_9AGAM|nr:Aldo/keto reductase [Sistotremastrum suecicum HHB10207 ss-3]
MANIATKTLNDGAKIPALGFGTGGAHFGKSADAAASLAIKAGFTHLDTAQAYQNEDSLGISIAEAGPSIRPKLFICTKLTLLPPGKSVREAFLESLKKLQIDYVDMFLIHSPMFVVGRMKEVWEEIESFQKEGLAKTIGVSNFRVGDLEELLKTAKVIPAVNQIEYHPYTAKSAQPILEFNKKHGIATESYGGLTSIVKQPGGPVDPVVAKIRQRLISTTGKQDITDAQVLLKWLEAKDLIILTTTSKWERLQEYLAAASLPPLTSEEVQAIDDAGSQVHFRRYQIMKHMDAPYVANAPAPKL